MPYGLRRFQQSESLHFITFSCFHRLPYLAAPEAKSLTETLLEQIRARHQARIYAYVLMPEHLHLLINEPSTAMPAPHLTFEFDPAKASSNLAKHGVSFREAMTTFDDPLASELPDDQHSDEEQRFILVGLSSSHRLLFVVYTETTSGIRLIGARLATATERQQYEELS